jgi:2-amino-4-hydroxy-6-hydroxymethyldihydropteridine diphosphokinase
LTGIYLGLGANLGDRQANLTSALRLLPPLVRVEAVSPLYQSPPQPPAPPPDYLNAACRVATELAPLPFLRHLKQIEARLGRKDTGHWGPRPIDLDILLFNDEVIATDELTIPHARLAERPFVLRPLLDLDAELVHPATGERLGDLLARLGDYELRLITKEWASD